MDLHGSGVGIIENGASRLWLKDGCVGASGVNLSLVCFISMYWLDASTRAAHLDPSMDVEKPRHANTQQHVGGPRTRQYPVKRVKTTRDATQTHESQMRHAHGPRQ